MKAVKEVTVRIPTVSLQYNDIVYLRMLAATADNTAGLSNRLPTIRLERLRNLGLIQRKPVPPAKEYEQTQKREIKEHKPRLVAALRAEDWEQVGNIASRLRYATQRLQPQLQDVITTAGRRLLDSGEIKVKCR